MKSLTSVMIAALLMAVAASAQVPRFRGPERISVGGTPIDLGYYTAPVMADWNRDGKKDMIVGQFSFGQIAYFENVGNDSSPVFNSYEYLQADGQIIQLPYG